MPSEEQHVNAHETVSIWLPWRRKQQKGTNKRDSGLSVYDFWPLKQESVTPPPELPIEAFVMTMC